MPTITVKTLNTEECQTYNGHKITEEQRATFHLHKENALLCSMAKQDNSLYSAINLASHITVKSEVNSYTATS